MNINFIKYIFSIFSIAFKKSFKSASFITLHNIIRGILPTIEILLMARFIDKAISIVQNKANYIEIVIPIILIALLVSYNWLSDKLIEFAQIKLEMNLKENYRVEIIKKIASLEYRYIEDEESCNLISRVSKEPEIEIKNSFNNLLSLMRLVFKISGIFIILFAYSWWLSLVVSIISVPLFIISIKSSKANYEVSKDVSLYRRKSDYLGLLLTSRDNIDERALFRYGDELSKKWINIYEKTRKIEFKVKTKWFIKMKMGSIISAILSILILFVFIIPVRDGIISAGIFISISNSMFSLIQDMSWELTFLMESIAKSREYIKELNILFSFKESKGSIDMPSNDKELILETLEFKNVYFKYPGTKQYILKNLNLFIERGKHYSIVGINGAGKTTITKLITGLYDDFEGEILINGISIKNFSQSELKLLTSVVYQDFAKYNISLIDNIALGNINNISKKHCNEEIFNIIKIMGLEEKINSLEYGIETELGKLKENSVDLSGGQWQKLAMVRSLISKSSLRILDEPTSALDPISESNFYEMYSKFSNNTTIFISHRLGSTKLADKIFVIGNGCVIESGSHKELIDNKGIYYEMYEKQKGWYAC